MEDTSATMRVPESSTSSVVMVPADQVAAMIEQLKLDQVRMLKEQQQVIVQQVMKTLLASGATPATPSSSAASVAASQPTAKQHRRRQQQSPSKLEQNLHALVLHSLEESGLDYPHVQRTTLQAQDPCQEARNLTLMRTRPPVKPTTLIVSRRETIDDGESVASTARDAEEVSERCSGEMSAQHVKSAQARSQVVSGARVSPLQFARAATQQKKTRHRRRRAHRQTQDDDDDEGPERDADFNAVRNRVGHKTLAILDRSRALLDEMKKLPTTAQRQQRDIAQSEPTFVHRMRQKLAEAESLDTDDTDDNRVDHPESSPNGFGETTVEIPHVTPAEEIEITEAAAVERPKSKQNARPRSGHSDLTPVTPQHTNSSVTCEDIEILRPPDHTPENEHEWENELARQILTIYATSVKAKAATNNNRPSSRPGSRPVDTSTGHKPGAPRLSTSCSLPAIGKSKLNGPPREGSSPHRAAVHYSWEPSQRRQDGKVIVNMPKVPKPIWFAGTGAVKSVWCGLAEGFHGLHNAGSPSKCKQLRPVATMAVCEHQLCEEIRRLEAKQQYSQCITTLETLLISLVRARGVASLETKLWKQLVVTCNAFASRCVDYKKFQAALQLIKQAEHLLHNSILVSDATRFELLAYLYDTYAHYYYKRGKSHAGLQYMLKAHEIHTRQSSWAHLAKCRLHIANLLSSQSKHDDAMRYMASILDMIEENKLENPGATSDAGATGDGSASAQKICLAAVCYNNLAIEQLHLREFEAASVSTGNAKRLAKLCLSYSNRWLAQFDATGNCVDLAIATLMEDVNAASNAAYKAT